MIVHFSGNESVICVKINLNVLYVQDAPDKRDKTTEFTKGRHTSLVISPFGSVLKFLIISNPL